MQGSLVVGILRDWRACSSLGSRVEAEEEEGVVVGGLGEEGVVAGGLGEEVGDGVGETAGLVVLGVVAAAAEVTVVTERRRSRRLRRRRNAGGSFMTPGSVNELEEVK
ncbi:hypothetical protein SLEP1_g7878 [Rubroshorea leprosula]|uniref:Uncharacterized protein n=1 Tax=Rubroshorea leprosula TaxID=152421 RepID=A0AAV5I4D1_9ROSI|nr:hypothetical protein SLEP1_g7878 [Rubroshorea leprosula]